MEYNYPRLLQKAELWNLRIHGWLGHDYKRKRNEAQENRNKRKATECTPKAPA